jgi:hypothetical protein
MTPYFVPFQFDYGNLQEFVAVAHCCVFARLLSIRLTHTAAVMNEMNEPFYFCGGGKKQKQVFLLFVFSLTFSSFHFFVGENVSREIERESALKAAGVRGARS